MLSITLPVSHFLDNNMAVINLYVDSNTTDNTIHYNDTCLSVNRYFWAPTYMFGIDK